MGRIAAGTLVTVVLMLGMQAQVLGGGAVPRGAPAERLVYVFSPADPIHRQRAERLLAWTRGSSPVVDLVGVVRNHGSGYAAAEDLDLGFPVVPVGRLGSAGLPEDLLDGIPADSDYGLLLNAADGVRWIEPGADVAAALAAGSAPQLVTDIDESTWGKIKELFR